MVRRRGIGSLGIILLGYKVMKLGVKHIPPATLSLIAGNTAIFLDVLPQPFPSDISVCMSSYLVYHEDWRRMILAQFFHLNDIHLYLNMISLLYHGTPLERKFGTPYFVYMTAVFTVLTGAAYVGLEFVLSELSGNPKHLSTCAVGFSGVLFAMQVLTTSYSPAQTLYILGLVPVPSKHAYWVDLILIQTIYPNASAMCHLAGILVGLAYVKGPLKFLMDVFLSPEDSVRKEGSCVDPALYSQSNPQLQRNTSSSSVDPAPYPQSNQATPSAPPLDPSDVGFEADNNNNGIVPSQNPAYNRYTGEGCSMEIKSGEINACGEWTRKNYI